MPRRQICMECQCCHTIIYGPTSSDMEVKLTSEDENPVALTKEHLQSVQVVFASLVAGLRFNAVKELFGNMGLPLLPVESYQKIEKKLGKKIWKYWEESRKKAHDEERAAAIERGDFDMVTEPEDRPRVYLGVTGDGG